MLQCRQVEIEARLSVESLFFEAGQFWHLLGPNGAGKTTFLSLTAGLLSEYAGAVKLNDIAINKLSLHELAQHRCLLEQSYQCPFAITVEELLLFYQPTENSRQVQNIAVPELLEGALQINDFLNKRMDQLSGGERQRVQIARCLLQVWPKASEGKALILLDEPLASLDLKYQIKLMDLCTTLVSLGNLVVISSHDINLSARYASHIALFKAARLVYSGLSSDILQETIIEEIFDQAVTCLKVTSNSQKVFISA